MDNNIISNTLYYLQKCQIILTQLNTQYQLKVQHWIKEIDECQMKLEAHQNSHPLYDQCLTFITERIIVPFLNDLDTLAHSVNVVSELKKCELKINYAIKRLTLISEFIPSVVKVPLDDLFCKPPNHEEWLTLNKFIEFVNLDDPLTLSKQFDHFYDYIALGAAYCTLGNKFKFSVLNLIVQNVGGALMLIKKETARQIKLKEITNPSLAFIQGLWSIQNNSAFFKNFMKLTNCSIKSHYKIYVPFLFQEHFGSLEDIYKIEEFKGFKMTEDLYNKIQSQELFKKDRINKIKVRILSAGKVEFKKNVDYSQVVGKITEVSSDHHQIHKEQNLVVQKNKIKKVVLHIHGGGWVAMSSFSHQSYTRKWANYVGEDMIIFSIDYRLSPQYRYPYALEDVWQLYLWIINFSSFYMNIDIGELIIAGDSAGGNMALGVCFRAIKYGLRIPDGLLMAYPAVNLDFTAFNPYLLQGLVDEVAPATILKLALDEYLKGTNANPSIDPYLSPLIAHDSFMERLPKMTIMCGELDSLTGDTIKFANRLRKLNKKFKMQIFNGISHGFLNFEVPVFAVPAIKPLIERSCELLKQMFDQ